MELKFVSHAQLDLSSIKPLSNVNVQILLHTSMFMELAKLVPFLTIGIL